jgi:hypothetical protein
MVSCGQPTCSFVSIPPMSHVSCVAVACLARSVGSNVYRCHSLGSSSVHLATPPNLQPHFRDPARQLVQAEHQLSRKPSSINDSSPNCGSESCTNHRVASWQIKFQQRSNAYRPTYYILVFICSQRTGSASPYPAD